MTDQEFTEPDNSKKIYACPDAEGNIVAFYDETFPAETLDKCVEIGHDDWQACLQNNWCRKVVNGEIVSIQEPPQLSYEEASKQARAIRNKKLLETDWWAVTDRAMSQEQIDYRQALRDVPQQSGFPQEVVWPTKP